jgi:hypothetical protein
LHYSLWLGLGPETWPSQKAVGRVKSEKGQDTRTDRWKAAWLGCKEAQCGRRREKGIVHWTSPRAKKQKPWWLLPL